MRWLNRRFFLTLFSIFVVFFVTVGASSCDSSDQDKSRREDTALREDNFSKAENILPVPTDIHNFPLRAALIEFTRRQDMINHPWYIYIYSDLGDPLGYYIGKTYPINSCNFLSSSQKLVDVPNDGDSAADFIVDAPSLDGIYYGGGGASAACQSMFFFDVQTNAMYTFSANTWIASDKPLDGFEGPALGETKVEDIKNPDQITTPTPPTPVPTATEDQK